MSADFWTVTDAQARLDDVIDKAIAVGPQRVVDEDGIEVLVVSAEDWQRTEPQQPTSVAGR